MRANFKAALDRVQGDYGFYVECQTDPATALAEYRLSPEERAILSDPARLEEVLQQDTATRAIKITISGTHDWVNRTAPPRQSAVAELLAQEVESVQQAESDAERDESALRLIRLLG
jgi:hypothetical protein